MRGTRIAFALAIVVQPFACGLFPSLGDLVGDAGGDATAEGAVVDSGGDADALVATTDAAWARIDTEVAFASDGGSVAVTSPLVHTGDLLILGCDMAASAGD